MSLGVLNNINAIYAQNNLNNTSNSLSKVLQQLSSGSKISSGADDAAGLSLVNGLQANSQALSQSKTNASEGVGLLSVADGALSQVTNLLNRAVTLATESANGTLNTAQDTAANQEYQSILSEISNIGSTTTYNNQAVFGTKTNIFTGDSSAAGASVNSLNIRSLSSSNVGDSNGTMAYSSGTNNVFIDLSSSGKNAAVTDTLGTAAQTTTIAVSYLTQGAGGTAVTASANISVGAGTQFANTAQGLISAINGSGLGITAAFGTAANAGSAATSTAVGANDTNNALLTGSTDTGIIISGAGVGVNNSSATTGYSNGAGEIGTLTTAVSSDTLAGTLALTGSDGVSHSLSLGTVNSTDTLANLASTINAAGYGVTATVNTADVTNASGTHHAGTVLSFTSASSQAGVVTTSATDAAAATSTLTVQGAGSSVAALTTIGTLTDTNSATDTLTGVLKLTNGAGGAAVVTDVNMNGATLQSLFNSTNGTAVAALTAANMSVALTTNVNGQTVATFATIAATGGGGATGIATATGSQIQDSAAAAGSQGTADVIQTAAVAGNSTANFGTITVTNANDTFTGGTINLRDANGTAHAITLGTAGSTDNMTNLAATIGAFGGAGFFTASLNPAGTQITLATNGGGAAANVPTLYATGVTTSLSLTGAPTAAGTASSTVMGVLNLPAAGASTDTLGGTLKIGTETIALGVAASTSTPGTANMAELAQTINAGNYGITAALSSNGKSMTFSSTNSNNINITPDVSAMTDVTAGGASTFTTQNQGVTSSAYYSIGISGTVQDTSTGANTTTALSKGNSSDVNGSGGVATISYSDSAGQSLANTDLTTQGNAQTTLTALNSAITAVAAQDGYIGAQINTLNSVSSVLATQSENVTSAQNAVQATDYASATSNMSKYQILSQTGISALAQANSMQQEVTKLLQ